MAKNFLSAELSHIFHYKVITEIDNYDIELLKWLSRGILQDSIELKFKELKIRTNSKSTIEKRINRLKIYFKANNTIHLIAIAKDLGIV